MQYTFIHYTYFIYLLIHTYCYYFFYHMRRALLMDKFNYTILLGSSVRKNTLRRPLNYSGTFNLYTNTFALAFAYFSQMDGEKGSFNNVHCSKVLESNITKLCCQYLSCWSFAEAMARRIIASLLVKAIRGKSVRTKICEKRGKVWINELLLWAP